MEDNYDLEEMLAQSAEARIYRGLEKDSGERVVIWRFPLDEAGQAEFEAQLAQLKQMTAPHLRKVRGGWLNPEGSEAYVVADWWDGTTLDAWSTEQSLPPAEVVNCLKQSSELLNHLPDEAHPAVSFEPHDVVVSQLADGAIYYTFHLNPMVWLGITTAPRQNLAAELAKLTETADQGSVEAAGTSHHEPAPEISTPQGPRAGLEQETEPHQSTQAPTEPSPRLLTRGPSQPDSAGRLRPPHAGVADAPAVPSPVAKPSTATRGGGHLANWIIMALLLGIGVMIALIVTNDRKPPSPAHDPKPAASLQEISAQAPEPHAENTPAEPAEPAEPPALKKASHLSSAPYAQATAGESLEVFTVADSEVLRDLMGQEIILEGHVQRIRQSQSGQYWDIIFRDGAFPAACAIVVQGRGQEKLDYQELQEYLGKHVQVRGQLAERPWSPGKVRPAVEILTADQISIIE